MNWHDLKLLVVDLSGLSRDALHVFGGVAGQVLAALILKRSLASPLPWVLIGAIALSNEAYDFSYEVWVDRSMAPEIVRDLWVTMAIPTLILCLARWAPGLLVGPDAAAGASRARRSRNAHGPPNMLAEALGGLNDTLVRTRSETRALGRRSSRGKTVMVRGYAIDVVFMSALAGLLLLIAVAVAVLR